MKKLWLDFWHGAVLGSIWQIRRQLAWNKTGGLCHYCKEVLTDKTFTVDHIIPLAKGGTDCLANLAACCKFCNKVKADGLLNNHLLAKMLEMKFVREKHLPKPIPYIVHEK